MKIGVVGCGAVGSYYGARLARVGHEVHFLLRSDYQSVQRRGVLIRSPQGDFSVRPRAARSPREMGVCELVLIGLKTTANDQFPSLLPPLVGAMTGVVTLQNGLGNEEQLARFLPADQILGGLCFVCLNRIEPGVIQHLDHGLVVLGEFSGWPRPRTHDLAGAFRHAGIPCNVTDNLARAHWEKLVWNVPFNGLGVAAAGGAAALTFLKQCNSESCRRRTKESLIVESYGDAEAPGSERLLASSTASPRANPCRTTDQLLDGGQWEQLVRELMLEVIAVARDLGHDIPDSLADKQIGRTRTMGPYKASTLIDFERGQPLELHSLFLEPLRQAKLVGLAPPRLQALCALLTRMEQSRSAGDPGS